jgi:fructokinase
MNALDAVIVGEALVDFLPTVRGRLRDVRVFEAHSGGAPANAAVGAARLGAKVAFVGVVGEDEFGHLLRNVLVEEGIDVSRLRHTGEAQTGLAFVAIDERGERSFMFYRRPSADWLLGPEDVDPDFLARGRIVHIGSNSLLLPSGVAALERILEVARDRDLVLSFDPNIRVHLWEDPSRLRALAGAIAGRATVVKCSAEEAEWVAGERDPYPAARALVARGAELAVVTRGADGAVWARRTDEGEVSAPRVEVADATGAGDGFTAGLLTRLSAELRQDLRPAAIPVERLRDHVAFSCRVGAAVCTRLGAVAGLPRHGEPLP